jgi:hypothetical protein
MIFLAALMSTFAAVMGMLAATFALITGPLMVAMTVCSTAVLGVLILILS